MDGFIRSGLIRSETAKMLSDAGIYQPFIEADRIICHLLREDRASLHAHPERLISPREAEFVMNLAARRARGEPLAYIIGFSLFLDREFMVESTLIPRPETEILTSLADEYIKKTSGSGILADWCTGSGCIAVTLAARNPRWSVYAADSNQAALLTASANCRFHSVRERVTLIECESPAEALQIVGEASLDLVVSNPPYIPTAVIDTLERQVRDYEPRVALDGGIDGLDVCRLMLVELPRLMKDGAAFFIETGGAGQVSELANLSGQAGRGLDFIRSFEDHRGIDRFMLWIKSKKE
ncbi:MAG: peptide chain release factor N(5)-glutamine methyltransferase [Synergistaceae bacterium]|jgi:release factor glutamine methyltransferase|nr:peptide chain release factor N(5)-glutamine methyltransferase [Synergistaceae bacterium]